MLYTVDTVKVSKHLMEDCRQPCSTRTALVAIWGLWLLSAGLSFRASARRTQYLSQEAILVLLQASDISRVDRSNVSLAYVIWHMVMSKIQQPFRSRPCLNTPLSSP